jgi:hypothetical protein
MRFLVRAGTTVALVALAFAIVHHRERLAAWAVGHGAPAPATPPSPPSPPVPAPVAAPPPRTTVPQVTLKGPGGDLALPLDEPFILNVWLERCSDCMPHFEAWRSMVDGGDVFAALPVVNVAYGRADVAWAASYAVEEDLVFDPGAGVVKPMGISKFTTMVVRPDGSVAFRGHPAQPGFAQALATAAADARAYPLL